MKNKRRKEIIAGLIKDARKFRFCGPSDDPDEQTAVTTGYRDLIIQFKRLVVPILPPAAASQLSVLDVEIDDLYSAYDAHSELKALFPDIEAALDRLDDYGDLPVPVNGLSVIADSRLSELRTLVSAQFDFKKLNRLCEEINIVYSQGCYLAAAMLTRALLDHVRRFLGKTHSAKWLIIMAAGASRSKRTCTISRMPRGMLPTPICTCRFAKARHCQLPNR